MQAAYKSQCTSCRVHAAAPLLHGHRSPRHGNSNSLLPYPPRLPGCVLPQEELAFTVDQAIKWRKLSLCMGAAIAAAAVGVLAVKARAAWAARG